MTIALASDHGGFHLKEEITRYLQTQAIEILDFGCDTPNSCDYADFAVPACQAVIDRLADLAILVCGTGIGMSIAANKVHGIRAAVCGDCFSAKFTRKHNDANALCLGERVIGPGLALEIVDLFLHTTFEGGRHQVRIDKVAALERN